MAHIVLTDEQIRALREANGAIEARDAEGKVVTFLQPLEPYVVEAILKHRERRAQGGPREPGVPSARVQALLRKAHEIDEREGMTPEKMQELLRRARAGEEL
jgi:hypothetical protein